MASYGILPQQYNGTTYDTLYFKNNIEGTTTPTTSTVGFVGQQYVNTSNNTVYQCTNNNGGVYTWTLISQIDLNKFKYFEFETSTDWVAPSDIKNNEITVLCCGGGGAYNTGGGGAGGYITKTTFIVTPGTSYPIVIGAGAN